MHLHQKIVKIKNQKPYAKSCQKQKINIKSISDNIPNLSDELNSLMTKIRSNEIIINPADKGSIVVVMSFEYCYWKMCQSH